MTLRKGAPRPKQRWLGLAGIVGTLTLIAAAIAFAAPYTGGVQDTGLFALDGNTLPTTCGPADDWAALYTVGTANPCGSDAFKFVADGYDSADNTYWSGGGSKDAYDPANGPWMWSNNDVSPDKDDIENAFAAAYHITDSSGGTTDTTRFLFFGADRLATNGDAQMGFQFLQSDVCLAALSDGTNANDNPCPVSTPNQVANAGKFVDPTTGTPIHHLNGDLLILVNFNNGGTLGLAGVFEWAGADAAPNAAGNGSYSQVLFGDGADCKTIGDPNNFCSTATTSTLTGDPVWSFDRKSGNQTLHNYVPSSFVEGGVNLSAIPGAATCFPSFIAETRSSAGPSSGLGLTAQLKDIAFGKFQLCGSTFSTTPQTGAGADIPSGGLSIGTGTVTAKDSANLQVTGIDTWSGTLKFYLCGPIASSDLCDGTTHVGVKIGSDIAVDQSSPNPTLSAAATLTSAGRYCWRGVFTSATPGVPSRDDATSGECFTVNPVTPGLDTAAVASPVDFGQPVQDNAVLSGAATQPGTGGPSSEYPSINSPAGAAAGGKITFTLFGPDSCSTQTTGGTGSNPQDFTPISGNGSYGPVSYTPAAPGTYHWKAQYFHATGDVNNNDSVLHNGTCTDTDEDVVVNQVPTSITTRQFVYPQDIARITVSSGTLAGNVEFKLFGPTTGKTALENCTANTATGLVYSEAGSLHPISGASGQTATTDNKTFKIVDSAVTYVWRVTYTSTNPAQLGSSSACTETTTVTYVGNDTTNITP